VLAEQVVQEGQQLSFTATATDADLPAQLLTFSLETGAPPGANIHPATGAFTWTPSALEAPSTNTLTIRVIDDGSPSLSAVQSPRVIVRARERTPVLAVVTDQVVNEETSLVATNKATLAGVPAQNVVFSLGQGAPAGSAIDPVTGVFTWTPSEAQGPTTNQITVQVAARDAPSPAAAQTFQVIVNEVNGVPRLQTYAEQFAHAGRTLAVTIRASDPDLPENELTYGIEAGLPPGANFDATTGLFTWTPNASGIGKEFNITARVGDNGLPPLIDVTTFKVGTAPPLKIESVGVADGAVALTWTAIAGQTYRVQRKSDLTTSSCIDLLGDVTAATGTASKVDSGSALDSELQPDGSRAARLR